MTYGFTDWQDSGIWPTQDHEPNVPLHIRKQMVGGRVIHRPDPSVDKTGGPTEFGLENNLGTLGDIHPWFFWQTSDPAERGMGMWSMAHSGLVVSGGDGGFGSGRGGTGRPVKPSGLLPLRTGRVSLDARFRPKFPGWDPCLSSRVRGQMMMVMPGTEESAQHEVMLHADPRLVAVHTEGPGEAGTLVCDLQPEATMCMRPEGGDRDAKEPGIEGRAARLQSMMRVVPLHVASLAGLPGMGRGNAIAWNMAPAGVDKIAGNGLAWVQMKGGAVAPQGPTTGAGISGISSAYSAPSVVGASRSNGSTPCGFGTFAKKPAPQQGSTFLAQLPTCGPITGGSGRGDPHYMGNDKDGNPITSAHIDTNGYFHLDAFRDGPLLFEELPYPDVQELPLKVPVHLVWDPSLSHKWVQGTKPGKWRWYSSSHVLVPNETPPRRRDPRKPETGGPGAPRPGTPSTPGPGSPPGAGPGHPKTPGGGSGGGGTHPKTQPPGRFPEDENILRDPSGLLRPPGRDFEDIQGGGPGGGGTLSGRSGGRRDGLRWVGEGLAEDVGLFEVFHPLTEGFTSVSFRPQLTVNGFPSFVHNPEASDEDLRADEAARPQVLSMKAWGGTASGSWVYQNNPETSRARGGTAHGGVLLCPPAYTIEDYLGVNSLRDVRTIETASFLCAAPSVAFALGTPATNGGINPKSVAIAQVPKATDANESLWIYQQSAASVATTLLKGRIDQGTGEVTVEIGGTTGFIMPRGTTAQRPGTLDKTAAFRVNTTRESGTDTPEFWDAQQLSWTALSTGSASPAEVQAVEFTATDIFPYDHNRGVRPIVSVKDSSGYVVGVEVRHTSVNTVQLRFNGTLTDAVLILD